MFSKLHAIFDSFTDVERRVFQGAAIIFCFSFIANSVSLFYNETVVAPIEGGSYAEGLVGQPIVINPVLGAANDVDRDLIALLFSNLGNLMGTHSVSDDHRVWTIELKKDLVWSDGEPLTADDIVFTIETIQDPETNSPLAVTWNGVTVDRINPRTVRFALKTPYAFFLDNLRGLTIIPAHIFGSIPSANLRLSDYNLEPVGSGPYVFAGYEKEKIGLITRYSLSANERYAGTPPLIKHFSIQFFANKRDAIDAFNRREIDGLGGLDATELTDLKIGHNVYELDIPRYYAIFFNPSTAPALADSGVRAALAMATNIPEIIAQALNGKARRITGPIHPLIEGYSENIGNAEFSTENASSILEEKGWTINDDGVRSKGSGEDETLLAFELIVPNVNFLVTTANAIVEQWSRIGVKITPIVLSPAEITRNVIKTRNYDMILFGNILKGNPDIFSFWHSSERFHPGLNLAMYENEAVDTLLESIRKNFDSDSRNADIATLQKFIVEDAPAVFLYAPTYLYAVPKNLGGFKHTLTMTPSDRFDFVNRWYLKTARVFK